MAVTRYMHTFFASREALDEARQNIISEAVDYVASFIKQQALVKLQMGDGSHGGDSIVITVDVPCKYTASAGAFDPATLLGDLDRQAAAQVAGSKLRIETSPDVSIGDVTVSLYEPRGFSSPVPGGHIRYTVVFTKLDPF